MEREIVSARPSSMRPPTAISIPPRTASAMSAAARPLTQQGLTGLKPATAGSQRIHKDSRYYLSLVQSRNAAIRDEIARLKKLTEENKMKTLNLEEMHKKAQEMAKQIAKDQELLAAYNIALEMNISKSKEQDVHDEIEKIKRENEARMKQLDAIFEEKIKIQEKISRMEKERERKEKVVKQLIETLPDDQKVEYFRLKKLNEQIVAEMQEIQEEIKKDKEENEKLKAKIAESPELQEKFKLLQTFNNLQTQERELREFLSNVKTPQEQREQLLQQVKQDKIEIEKLEKVLQTLEGEIAEMEEKISDINKELENKDNARLKKHKELRERENHMDAFIESYQEKVGGAKLKLVHSNQTVVNVLDRLVENLAEINLEGFGTIHFDMSDQSLESWKNRCTALQGQLNKLKRYTEFFDTESRRLTEEKNRLLKEIERMSDIEKCKEELNKERLRLEEENQILQAKLDSTQAAVDEASKRKEDIMKKLENNPTYHEVVQKQKRIEELENKKMEMEQNLEAERNDTSYKDVMTNFWELIKTRNEEIKAELRRKAGKIN